MAGHVDPPRRVVTGDHGHGGGLTGVGLTAAIGDYLRRGLRLRDAGEAPVLAGGSKRARVAGRCAGDERARRSEVGLDGDVLWRGFSSEREGKTSGAHKGSICGIEEVGETRWQ